jgi:hypothetical protein
VAGAIPRANVLGGVALFVVYGVGMSLVLVVVTLALALGKRGLVHRPRRSAGYVNHVSGAVLLLAGGYIVWFWATNLSEPLAASGPVTVIERWSSRLTELIGDRPPVWGLLLGVAAAGAAVYVLRQRHGRRSGPGRRGSGRRRWGEISLVMVRRTGEAPPAERLSRRKEVGDDPVGRFDQRGARVEVQQRPVPSAGSGQVLHRCRSAMAGASMSTRCRIAVVAARSVRSNTRASRPTWSAPRSTSDARGDPPGGSTSQRLPLLPVGLHRRQGPPLQ